MFVALGAFCRSVGQDAWQRVKTQGGGRGTRGSRGTCSSPKAILAARRAQGSGLFLVSGLSRALALASIVIAVYVA